MTIKQSIKYYEDKANELHLMGAFEAADKCRKKAEELKNQQKG